MLFSAAAVPPIFALPAPFLAVVLSPIPDFVALRSLGFGFDPMVSGSPPSRHAPLPPCEAIAAAETSGGSTMLACLLAFLLFPL